MLSPEAACHPASQVQEPSCPTQSTLLTNQNNDAEGIAYDPVSLEAVMHKVVCTARLSTALLRTARLYTARLRTAPSVPAAQGYAHPLTCLPYTASPISAILDGPSAHQAHQAHNATQNTTDGGPQNAHTRYVRLFQVRSPVSRVGWISHVSTSSTSACPRMKTITGFIDSDSQDVNLSLLPSSYTLADPPPSPSPRRTRLRELVAE
ncbi:hypothetical protein DFP72DRAFT_1064506 [Ephemerocybe angulata]|uniref:Uncharacterized protein n=1 Tax=Ephemerocybe angulata TaxID=980116 RepID=A0A8H6I701_9AGAR|nr:hypothetical protein DFP72DRAFT_1064506 [Tulosesus angulatus]